jgi:hypothetical protein
MLRVLLLFGLLLMLAGCLEKVSEPEEQEEINFGAGKQSLLLSGDENTLFVSVGDKGMDVFDIHDATSPSLLHTYSTDDFTYALARVNDTLFLANGSEGVEVLDISTPQNIRYLATVRTGDDNATALAVSPDAQTLAIGTGEGVLLYDISLPDFPRYISKYESNGTIMDLSFNSEQSRLYLANFYYGFENVDITVPGRLELVGSVKLEGSASDIETDPNRHDVYISSLTSTLKKIDLSDERFPGVEFVYDAHDASLIWDMAFESSYNYLYLAKGEKGVTVLDMKTPGKITEAGYFDTNGTARGIVVNRSGTKAFVADGKEGLKVLDISDKSNPRRLGYTLF